MENELYSGKFNLITREGYEAMLAELRNFFDVERPKIVTEVTIAAAHGDRSENAEYIYGKKKLREIDRRMNFLKRRLDFAKVLDIQVLAEDGKIYFGSKVTICDAKNMQKTYLIVGEDEADINVGKISWKSPLGRALLFKKENDTVVFQTPADEEREVTVVAILGHPIP